MEITRYHYILTRRGVIPSINEHMERPEHTHCFPYPIPQATADLLSVIIYQFIFPTVLYQWIIQYILFPAFFYSAQLRCIHVAVYITHTFLLLSGISLCGFTTVVYLLMDIRGFICFSFALLEIKLLRICIYVFVQTYVFIYIG